VADAGAARPVDHRLGDAVEREVDIAEAQIAGDVGQPRAKHESEDAVAVIGDRMHEMEEDAAVAAHRAGNVAEYDERRRPAAAGRGGISGPSSGGTSMFSAGRTRASSFFSSSGLRQKT